LIERIKVDFPVDDTQEPKMFINRQVGQDFLSESLLLVFSELLLLRPPLHKKAVNLVQRWVPAIYEISKVINGWWLVLNHYEKEVQRQTGERLAVSSRIDCAHVRNALQARVKMSQCLHSLHSRRR
jgi:hypothetical protein